MNEWGIRLDKSMAEGGKKAWLLRKGMEWAAMSLCGHRGLKALVLRTPHLPRGSYRKPVNCYYLLMFRWDRHFLSCSVAFGFLVQSGKSAVISL